MIAQGKFPVRIGGRAGMFIVPLRVFSIVSGPAGQVAVPGIVEDDFGTAADPRRALSTDRRFVSSNDDRGHAGRAA